MTIIVPTVLAIDNFDTYARLIDNDLPHPVIADLVDYWLAIHEGDKWGHEINWHHADGPPLRPGF